MTMILFINPTSTYTITAFKHHEGLLESLLGFTLCCQFLELYRPPWQTFSIVSILSSCLLVPPGSFQLPHGYPLTCPGVHLSGVHLSGVHLSGGFRGHLSGVHLTGFSCPGFTCPEVHLSVVSGVTCPEVYLSGDSLVRGSLV